MNNLKILVLIIALVTINCKENSTDNNVDNSQNNTSGLVKVHLDMHDGFAGKIVAIYINDEQDYYSILSNLVSLAGPEASFSTHLVRGQNKLIVFLGDPGNIYNYVRDTTTFSLGSKNEYFIGLRFNNNIEVTIQDSAFVYY